MKLENDIRHIIKGIKSSVSSLTYNYFFPDDTSFGIIDVVHFWKWKIWLVQLNTNDGLIK